METAVKNSLVDQLRNRMMVPQPGTGVRYSPVGGKPSPLEGTVYVKPNSYAAKVVYESSLVNKISSALSGQRMATAQPTPLGEPRTLPDPSKGVPSILETLPSPVEDAANMLVDRLNSASRGTNILNTVTAQASRRDVGLEPSPEEQIATSIAERINGIQKSMQGIAKGPDPDRKSYLVLQTHTTPTTIPGQIGLKMDTYIVQYTHPDDSYEEFELPDPRNVDGHVVYPTAWRKKQVEDENLTPKEQEAASKTNRDAMPPMEVSPRPGPSDWINKNGSVCDGDLITLRNLAWKGCTVKHSWNAAALVPGGVLVNGEKHAQGKITLARTRMDNEFSFVIRRLVFDHDKVAFTMPSWTAWKDRKPITKKDYFCLLAPNDPWLAMGTREPPNSAGNNGDYKVGLFPFPVCTSAELNQHTIKGFLKNAVSFGFWKASKKHIDFLQQSRCVWSFHAIGVDNPDGPVSFGSSPINIRNTWTEMKSQSIQWWEFVASNQVTLVGNIINRTFHGGRNLTMAAGSGGNVVKLALHNNDTDDKAGWIIDGWHGNQYAVQRSLVPTTAVPPGSEPVPNLDDQRTHPPPSIPGLLVLDPNTGTNVNIGLPAALDNQNPYSILDWICYYLFKQRWANLGALDRMKVVVIIIVVGGASSFIIGGLGFNIIMQQFDRANKASVEAFWAQKEKMTPSAPLADE